MEFKKLKDLLQYSYAPWSKFRVAAIAIDEKGDEYVGVNVENAAFPSGLCAERSALFGSVARGAKVGTFKEIHIVSSSEDIITPCGGCLQVITEFMPNDAYVVQYSNDGTKVRRSKVSDIMPYQIRTEHIK